MAEADRSVIVRSEQEEAYGETETGEYLTTSCSSDMESSLGSNDSRVTIVQYNRKIIAYHA